MCVPTMVRTRRSRWPQRLQLKPLHGLLVACLSVLTACGGGDGSGKTGIAPLAVNYVEIRGSVIDGPIEGARVFLDFNQNLEQDEDEPISTATDANGQFVLSVPDMPPTRYQNAYLVAKLTPDVRDADDRGKTLEEAERKVMTLATPLQAYISSNFDNLTTIQPVLSPLTTMVVALIAQTDAPFEEAKHMAVERMELLGNDPMQDFIKQNNLNLARIAKQVALHLGDSEARIAQAHPAESATDAKERFVTAADLAVTQYVIQRTPPPVVDTSDELSSQ